MSMPLCNKCMDAKTIRGVGCVRGVFGGGSSLCDSDRTRESSIQYTKYLLDGTEFRYLTIVETTVEHRGHPVTHIPNGWTHKHAHTRKELNTRNTCWMERRSNVCLS
ncbi:hypothetical protein BaRGS_00002146 [Batillaria attramentaria]|uniref:Uncharacterized protein n=1 Tax=Batillaria attramentaria TaxID=370345 RepID=A0ABD0M5M3_9CAEN